jgi:hypothetical protein
MIMVGDEKDAYENLGENAGRALLFVSVSHPDDTKKLKTQARIRQHVMKNIGRARRQAVSNREHSMHLHQSQLPVLPYATPPIQWRFYMPAFINNCELHSFLRVMTN